MSAEETPDSNAFAKARRMHHHRRHVRALDRALDCDPYVDIEARYPRVELRESWAFFAALLREHTREAS